MTLFRAVALLVVVGPALVGLPSGLAALQDNGFGCDDFLTQQAAQIQLDMNPSDPFGLDTDGNGIACDEPGNQVASEKPIASGAEAPEGTSDAPTGQESETSAAPSAMIGALPAPPAGSQEVTLNGFLDGEMFKVRVGDQQETIRMIGVDTPEVERWECLGFAALDRVRALLQLDATYYVETAPEVRDGEERLYAYLWYPAADGYRLLSETLLAEGYAGFIEPDNEHAQYTGPLMAALQSAQDSELGIWGQCGGDWHLKMSPCEPVDPAVADYISANLEGGLWLRGVQGVRSPSYVHVYLIGGEIEGPGREGDSDIGIWWMPGGPDAASAQLYAIQSMAGHAGYVSGFESMGILESADTMGYNEAERCVRDALG